LRQKAPENSGAFVISPFMKRVIAFYKKAPGIFSGIVLLAMFTAGCETKPAPEKHVKVDYIRRIPGPSDSIPLNEIQRGEVLIAYSDCQECHTRDKRSKGPAFRDIAQRYPVNKGYILLLSQKIIQGGSGAWGKSVMLPHPKLSTQDAALMVKYILSLKP
jgi:cytochrome c